MTEEHISKLKSDFPAMYDQLIKFDIDDGWYTIIYKLSGRLAKEIAKLKRDKSYPPFRVTQLTSRMGRLVIYTSAMPRSFEPWCTEAENQCAITCQVCGARATKGLTGLCKRCNPQRLEKS